LLTGWKKIVALTKVVPDTSAIINQVLSKNLTEYKIKEIVVHRALLSELENQANQGRETGFIGLDELKTLKESKVKITFKGDVLTNEEIILAKRGAIDEIIRNMALTEKATLLTSDRVQAEVALASDISVKFIESYKQIKALSFEKFFKPEYMSVHLKEGNVAKAKKGTPGNWSFVEVSKTKLTDKKLNEIADEITSAARGLKNSFLETNRKGIIIAQIKNYRIVATRPPLSDAWEITIVRPVKKLNLSDYKLSSKIMTRLESRAEGILISGSPGSGKSTFAQSLATKYASLNKVVKSLESPRDMQLPAEVTQYSLNKASHDDLRDILLLTRPDYTLYDEVRNLSDFKLFSDMRLAGVGMVGVVHASNPIDSIQRFIGKVEVGMIPSIVDTVIFIRNGQVEKVYGLRMGVKVPSGMREKDLARPVVDIFDYDTDELEYEIYSYGDSTVVMPVKEVKRKERESRRQLRWRLIETSKYFEFLFFTPTKNVEVIIDKVLVSKLPVQKGKSLKIMKRSALGKEIKHAFRNRLELKFA